MLRTGAAMFAAAVLGGGLAIPLGIVGGDTAHTVVPSHRSLAANGVINSNGVRVGTGSIVLADGGLINSDGIGPADGGVISSDGVRPAANGVINSDGVGPAD